MTTPSPVPGLAVLAAFLFLTACSATQTKEDSGTLPRDQHTATEVNDQVPDSQDPQACAFPLSQEDPAWYQGLVAYEIFVRSFQDSDGDGVGDFKGLTSRLDYLNDGKPGGDDLGVELIWLMPVNPSPSYHGYDVTDYRGINPDYGTPADFQEFLEQAHARGIKVIMDLVLNHSSSEHPWFKASAQGDNQEDWYVWSEQARDWTQPWGSGKTWHQSGSRWYYGVFWSGMPDLNYTNPDVTREMVEVARYWLDQGLDGFRLDAVRYLIETGPGDGVQDTNQTLDWWASFSAAVADINPSALLVGEAWAGAGIASQYRKAGLAMTFDFDLSAAIIGAIKAGDPVDLENVLCRYGKHYPQASGEGTFLTNHDMIRVASELGETLPNQRLAATLLLTLPGTPFIYYGEEVGMLNGGINDDKMKRKPMQWNPEPLGGFTTGTPWEPLGREVETRNVQTQSEDPDSLLSLYRELIRLRKENPALALGNLLPQQATSATTGDLWAFSRTLGDQTILCIFNLGDANALNVRVRYPGTSGRDLLSGTDLSGDGEQLPVGDLLPKNFRLIRIN